MNVIGITGEVHRGLAGGVCSADDVDGLLFAGHGFSEGRAVVDAGSAEFVGAGDVEFAVVYAGGDEADVAGDLVAVFHLDDAVLVFAADVGDALGEELGAETVGLEVGALGELFAAETFGEAEVVFDLGAGASLSAGGCGFDDEGAEAL